MNHRFHRHRSWKIGLLLVLALISAALYQKNRPFSTWRSQSLGEPPGRLLWHLSTLDDPLPMAKLLNLYVQGHDVQEGVSIPLRHLDYPAIQNWLSWIAQIDPKGSYPFFIASHFYTQQPDPKRIRLMTEFVASRYAQNPAHRWPFLAHAVYIARAQLKDDALAKLYAIQLREQAQAFGVLGLIPPWAAQMELFLQTDISHQQAHRALIGGLVHSGQIQDPHTWTFLKQKLEQDQTQDNNQYKRSHTDIP